MLKVASRVPRHPIFAAALGGGPLRPNWPRLAGGVAVTPELTAWLHLYYIMPLYVIYIIR